MRTATAISMLLAVVATALVGVHERSEICRLRYRVFEAERKRDAQERQLRELDSRVADALSPRRLLEENDRRPAAAPPAAPAEGDWVDPIWVPAAPAEPAPPQAIHMVGGPP